MNRLGLDIGSTTLKCAVLSEEGEVLFSAYRRHYSKIAKTAHEMLLLLQEKFSQQTFAATISGSAGMGIAQDCGVPFVQEVFAEKLCVSRFAPQTDAVIELGGEDAKILFLTDGFEMRMNGSCAGGTGAFIDQMASLLHCEPEELDTLAQKHTKVCTIASRCGVFAKSDIQPLLNQGESKENIAAGIFYAVAEQTVAGLAQGRRPQGNILYLGGPLSFSQSLRAAFDDVLGQTGRCPDYALYAVAIGAALSEIGEAVTVQALSECICARKGKAFQHEAPLFSSEEEYAAFCARHAGAKGGARLLDAPQGQMYLGIDAGSTTVKAVLCDAQGNLFRPFYSTNQGSPIPMLRDYLEALYRDFPQIEIAGACATGYGESLVKHAFSLDCGIVETVAHYLAAKRCEPDVDFIIDIGGQDIKCFCIRDGMMDDLYLNEACSSGCGSFLQTFAAALGYTPAEFAKVGLYAKAPVSLGSRCTVFMNSAVKQAQKDGASVSDIAAGLAVSVVKNALYKVIRCTDASSLGEHIVVQGGTFSNDLVLRAFERELGRDVTRPAYAPLMGAYGAALYAAAHAKENARSEILDAAALAEFSHRVSSVRCNGCTNHCMLTVNTFSGGRCYIAGNRCSKPLGAKAGQTATPQEYNLYAWKQERLAALQSGPAVPGAPTVGLSLGLNNYELLPFWHAFFCTLDCNVLVSPFSDHALYRLGQQYIPSDTACYPAKLMHGHIEWLLAKKPDIIFYPDMSYNMDEGKGVDHFNCPVVAYYPQLLRLNTPGLNDANFVCDFLSPANQKQFTSRIFAVLSARFPACRPTKKRIRAAAQAAYAARDAYFAALRAEAEKALSYAAQTSRPVIVLSGRPYHVDPEINHGIDRLLCSLGAVVLTEDSISDCVAPFATAVRNQWTYHARLYAAARYVASRPLAENLHLVQLISFGCGVDAITSDEVREILQAQGREYTQIKIDEVSNMGAITIRLRSLFAVIAEKKTKNEEEKA